MPFLGNLEDISIVDVLQLLCVAKKSGVLTVEGPNGPASVVLRDGAITGAHHPSPEVHVGTVLIEMGLVGEPQLESALQQCATTGTPVVATLVQMGSVTREQGWAALAQLVERTVTTIVGWGKGRFSFDQNDGPASDDFRYVPTIVEETLGGIDTQQVLMEVLRVLDERNRSDSPSIDSAPPDEPPAPVEAFPLPATNPAVPQLIENNQATDRVHLAPAESSAVDGAHADDAGEVRAPVLQPIVLDRAHAGAPNEADRPREATAPRDERGARHAIVYSEDGFLRNLMVPTCEHYAIDLQIPATEHHLMLTIEQSVQQRRASPVVVDVTAPQDGDRLSRKHLQLVERIRRQFPALPLVLLGPSSREAYIRAFEVGARSYLPRVRGETPDQSTVRTRSAVRLVAACLDGYFRERDALCDGLALARREMKLLRQRVLQMAAPDGAVDVSLLLLEHVADYLERCIIFVVRRGDLLGLGAFGLGNGSETMATLVAGLKIPLDVPSLPRAVIEERIVYRGRIDDEVLANHLFAKIGPAASSEGLLLPLVGPERAIALIYADHGTKEPQPFATDALEVLASVASLALQRKTHRPTLAH